MQDKLKYGIKAHRTMSHTGEQAAADTGEPIETWFSSRERESGERTRITAVVANMRADRLTSPASVENALATELAKRFGGFTVDQITGGWVDESGEFHLESGLRWIVAFEPAADKLEKARELFTVAGVMLGEDWVHIEAETVDAHHTRAAN
jgi:hypothetical protein